MSRGPYKSQPPAGSFADLIQRFRSSPRYRSWAPITRTINDRILANFQDENGRALVSELRRGDVIAMRDEMADKPGAARNWLKVIRVLLDYAVDLEMVPTNVARTVPRLPAKHQEGYRTWREDEIEMFLDRHLVGTTPHLAMMLILCTGAARVDAVKLGPGNVSEGRIRYKRQKTQRVSDVWVDLPIMPELQAALDATPPRLTFLETAYGRQRTANSLTGSFYVWTTQAGLGDVDELGRKVSPHGLRKAQGRRLAEAGCTPNEIMAVLGHNDLKQVMTYTRAYDRRSAADSAAERLGNISGSKSNVTRLKRRDGA